MEEIQTQKVTASEISDLAVQLEGIEEKLTSIDNNFTSLESERNDVNKELREEEAKPRGFWHRLPLIGGTLRTRKIGGLFSRSQELAEEMSAVSAAHRSGR